VPPPLVVRVEQRGGERVVPEHVRLGQCLLGGLGGLRCVGSGVGVMLLVCCNRYIKTGQTGKFIIQGTMPSTISTLEPQLLMTRTHARTHRFVGD
jgi:hypothetical protein